MGTPQVTHGCLVPADSVPLLTASVTNPWCRVMRSRVFTCNWHLGAVFYSSSVFKCTYSSGVHVFMMCSVEMVLYVWLAQPPSALFNQSDTPDWPATLTHSYRWSCLTLAHPSHHTALLLASCSWSSHCSMKMWRHSVWTIHLGWTSGLVSVDFI